MLKLNIAPLIFQRASISHFSEAAHNIPEETGRCSFTAIWINIQACAVVRRLKNSFFFGSSGAFYCDFYEV
jgi:hypothetical protein